jgi:hypothetical protein
VVNRSLPPYVIHLLSILLLLLLLL